MSTDIDPTMQEAVDALTKSVVGQRIVAARKGTWSEPNKYFPDRPNEYRGHILTLADGSEVRIYPLDDCCAFAEIDRLLLHPENIEHVITGVKVEENYQKWYILADLGSVLDLDVSWSEGSGYYAYGFEISVVPA